MARVTSSKSFITQTDVRRSMMARERAACVTLIKRVARARAAMAIRRFARASAAPPPPSPLQSPPPPSPPPQSPPQSPPPLFTFYDDASRRRRKQQSSAINARRALIKRRRTFIFFSSFTVEKQNEKSAQVQKIDRSFPQIATATRLRRVVKIDEEEGVDCVRARAQEANRL